MDKLKRKSHFFLVVFGLLVWQAFGKEFCDSKGSEADAACDIMDPDSTAKESLISEGNDQSTFNFKTPSWKTDFVLIVERQKLYVSKTILALASPVFEKRFSSQSTDDALKSDNELELPGHSVQEVTEFLQCIYPQTLSPITIQNAELILPLVHEFEVDHLKQRCEKVILESIDNKTDADRLFDLLGKGHAYGLKSLSDKCSDLSAMKSQIEITNAEKKHPIPAQKVVEVLRKLNTRLTDKMNDVIEEAKSLSKAACEYYTMGDEKLCKDLPFFGRSVELILPMSDEHVVKQSVTGLFNVSLTVSVWNEFVINNDNTVYEKRVFGKISSDGAFQKLKLRACFFLFDDRSYYAHVDLEAIETPKQIRKIKSWYSQFNINAFRIMVSILVYESNDS